MRSSSRQSTASSRFRVILIRLSPDLTTYSSAIVSPGAIFGEKEQSGVDRGQLLRGCDPGLPAQCSDARLAQQVAGLRQIAGGDPLVGGLNQPPQLPPCSQSASATQETAPRASRRAAVEGEGVGPSASHPQALAFHRSSTELCRAPRWKWGQVAGTVLGDVDGFEALEVCPRV